MAHGQPLRRFQRRANHQVPPQSTGSPHARFSQAMSPELFGRHPSLSWLLIILITPDIHLWKDFIQESDQGLSRSMITPDIHPGRILSMS